MDIPNEQQLREVFKIKGITQPIRLDTIDSVMPLVEELRKDGSIFLFKVDGERDPLTGNPFTFVVSGKKIGNDFLRMDSTDLLAGMKYVLYEYAKRYWLEKR
jgi:hypothetical protein